jgi:endonuclease G
MNRLIGLIVVVMSSISVFAQEDLKTKTAELGALKSKEKDLVAEIETLKLAELRGMMKTAGYPTSKTELEIIEHSLITLGFDCKYNMATWSFHMLTPDVSFGNVTRTDDFREDEKVKCGSAGEADYFLRKENLDGTYTFDGFGFDRGHLAPSADFRWSATALSESYYYSNMTPQRKEFNRESWANLEGLLRTVVDQEKKTFYILTGPILNENLPIIERSLNQLRIPQLHYKIIVDLSQEKPRGMAFLMPNTKCEGRLSDYVVSIDSIEQLTGLDFFPSIDNALELQIESKSDFNDWKTQRNTIDVEPLSPFELPKNYFNTQQAASKVGSTVSIVGKVVSTKFIPKLEATFLNLDQSFPNQLFSITIWKNGRRNFSYKPEDELKGKYISVIGKVELDKNGIPAINVIKEEQIQIWDEEVEK